MENQVRATLDLQENLLELAHPANGRIPQSKDIIPPDKAVELHSTLETLETPLIYNSEKTASPININIFLSSLVQSLDKENI